MGEPIHPQDFDAESWQDNGELVAERTTLSPREAAVFLQTTDHLSGWQGNPDPTLQRCIELTAESYGIDPSTAETYWRRANDKIDDVERQRREVEETAKFGDAPIEYVLHLHELQERAEEMEELFGVEG